MKEARGEYSSSVDPVVADIVRGIPGPEPYVSAGTSEFIEFIARREETFQAIGTGDIQPHKPWVQRNPESDRPGRRGDAMDATVKVVRAKEAVQGSLESFYGELNVVFTTELARKEADLKVIEEGGEKDYVPIHIVELHREEVADFAEWPERSAILGRALAAEVSLHAEPLPESKTPREIYDGRTRRTENDFEYTLPDGSTFFGKPAELLQQLSVRGDRTRLGLIRGDDLAITLWPDAPLLAARGRLYSTVKQIRAGLEGTQYEIQSRQSWGGGYGLRQKHGEK